MQPSDPKFAPTFLLVIVCLLGGCAHLANINVFDREPYAIAVAYQLTTPGLTGEAMNQQVEAVHQRYQQSPTAENLLAVAVTYGVPGHALSSTSLALEFLKKLPPDSLRANSAELAHWLETEYEYRLTLERAQTAAAARLVESNDALARAREKIQILTRIERTLGATGETEQPDINQPDGETR